MNDKPPKYTLSRHASDALLKRQIKPEWLERALTSPDRQEPDQVDPQLEHRLIAIPEFGGRVLRVVINPIAFPVFVVTIFFDRRVRGKLK